MIAVNIVWVICLALTVFVGLIAIKNGVTFRAHMTISYAIHRYTTEQILNERYEFDVTYDDMESYEKTLFRIWDWGYKRILPPDKFEIVKPYIVKM